MEDRLRNHLQSQTVEFIRDMIAVPAVVNYLVGKHILTPGMVEEIDAEKTRGDKARYIHTLIPKRGPKAFDAYYLAMRTSGNDSLARLLEPQVTVALRMQSPEVRLDPIFAPGSGEPRHTQETCTKMPIVTSPEEDQDETDLPPDWPDVSKSFLDVKVKPCERSNSRIMKIFKDGLAYPMTKVPLGRVVIINNQIFDGLTEDTKKPLLYREGTDVDGTTLDLLFEQLGFAGNIKLYPNLTAQQILDNLGFEASERQRSEDCFICAVLSHGTMGSVYGTDGKKVSLTQITDCFDGSNCPNLAGKPKLFFMQACQGETKDLAGATSVQETGPDSASMKDLDEQFHNLHIDHDRGAKEQTDASVDVPTKADILVATATTPGYVSWRNTERGSWFIQALVYVLENLAHKYDILTLLTRVNNLVAKNSTSRHGCKQVSQKKDTLTKDFYFFPGLQEGSSPK